VVLQSDTGGGKGVVAGGAQYGGSIRWRREERREGRDVRPMKNQTERIPPVLLLFHLRFSSIHPPFPISANLLLPVNVTRSTARGRSCTGSDEISTNLFCYRILIRFAPSPLIQSCGRNSSSTNARSKITMEMVPYSCKKT